MPDDVLDWAKSLATSSPRVPSPGATKKRVLSQPEMEQTLRDAGWPEDAIPRMAAIGMGESSGNPNAVNPGKTTKEYSVGNWQINTLAHPEYDVEKLKDPLYNAKAALDVYRKAGNSFQPWGAFTNGSYRKFYKGKPLTSAADNADDLFGHIGNILQSGDTSSSDNGANEVFGQVNKILQAPTQAPSGPTNPQGAMLPVPAAQLPTQAPSQPTSPQGTMLPLQTMLSDQAPTTVPEAPETIQAQVTSMLDKKSPRKAVLLTEGYHTPLLARVKGLTPVKLPEGTLYVNTKKLGIDVKDVPAYVKQNGFAGLIGKVEDVGNNTGTGLALRTEDDKGNELATSIVSPENIAKQAIVDKAQFPQAAKQDVMPAQQAAKKRAAQLQSAEPTMTEEEAVPPTPEEAAQIQANAPSPKPSGMIPSIGTVKVDPNASDEDKVRQAANQLLVGKFSTRDGPITAQDVDDWISAAKATGNPDALVQGNRKLDQFSIYPNMLDQIRAMHAPSGEQLAEEQKQRVIAPATDEQLRQQATDQLKQEREIDARRDASFTTAKTGYTPEPYRDPTDAEIQQRMQELRDNEPSQEQKGRAYDVAQKIGAGEAGVYGGVGDILQQGAGLLRPLGLNRGLAGLGKEMGSVSAYRNRGQGAQGIGENVAGFLGESIPQLAELTMLPGGAVGKFAALGGLKAAGAGEPVSKVVEETAKGAATGKLFDVAGELKNPLVKLGTVFGGSAAINAVTGMPIDQNLQNSIVNTLFEAQNIYGPKIAGKFFRFWKGGEPITVGVTPKGEVVMPRNQKAVAGNDIVLDPENPVYKKVGEVANAPRTTQTLQPEQTGQRENPPSVETPSAPPAETVAKGEKEPWQMTRKEFAQQGGQDVTPTALKVTRPNGYQTEVARANEPSDRDSAHRDAVEEAFARGEKVPPEVLKEYPWLAAREAIKPYVESLRNLSDKELKAEAKKTAKDLNAWANNTPSLLPNGQLNPELGKQAGFEVSERMHAVDREIEARKTNSIADLNLAEKYGKTLAKPLRATEAPKTFAQFVSDKMGSDNWYVHDRPVKAREANGERRIKQSDYAKFAKEYEEQTGQNPFKSEKGFSITSQGQPRTTGVEGVVKRQIEQRNKAQREAETNPKTELPNNIAFKKASERLGDSVAYGAVDMNGTKHVNDTQGHEIGDQALKNVGDALTQARNEVDPQAQVFHLQGDEFSVIAKDKDTVQKIIDRADEIHGEKKYGEASTTLAGAAGDSYADADSKAIAAKDARKAKMENPPPGRGENASPLATGEHKAKIESVIASLNLPAKAQERTRRYFSAIIDKDVNSKDFNNAVKYVADNNNPQTRAAFEQITGVKLPDTAEMREHFLRRYAGTEPDFRNYLTPAQSAKLIKDNNGKTVQIDWSGRLARTHRGVRSATDLKDVVLRGIDGKSVAYSYADRPNITLEQHIDNVRDIVVNGQSSLKAINDATDKQIQTRLEASRATLSANETQNQTGTTTGRDNEPTTPSGQGESGKGETGGGQAASTKRTEQPATLKPGDLVKDTAGRKGKIEAKPDGSLFVRQDATQASLPLSDKWAKTPAQIKLDKQAAKQARRTSVHGFPEDEPVAKQAETLKKEYENAPPPDPTNPLTSDSLADDDVHAQLAGKRDFTLSDEPLPGYEKSKVSNTKVIDAYAKVLEDAGRPTPIRTGTQRVRKAAGFYRPFSEIIRLKQANNIPTAAHEVFHAIHKIAFGRVGARTLDGLPAPARQELLKLGKALYGDTVPAGGYKSEGFAEFGRLYLTTDLAKQKAPAMYKYFTEDFLPNHPEMAKSLGDARDVTDNYRFQGAQNRVRADKNVVTLRTRVRAIINKIKATPTDWIDELTPLKHLAEGIQDLTGKKLPAGQNPYEVASAVKGSAGNVVRNMLFDGMVNSTGYKVGPSLNEIASLVSAGERRDFADYMHARMALRRWDEGKNPGMTKEDAQFIVKTLDSDKFQLAAQKVYDWQHGVLDYVSEMNPELSPVVQKILAKSVDYVPLMREFSDAEKVTGRFGSAGGNALLRMKGSGRRVNDIFPQIVANAERLVSAAQKQRVVQSIADLEQLEGVGSLLEKVPRQMQPTSGTIDSIKKQLEQAGVDLSEADLDQLITLFTPARTAKNGQPILSVVKDGKMQDYLVHPDLYNAVQGVDQYRLPPVFNLLFGMPKRLFTLGTTGLRASFSLVTNPLRDIPTGLMQTESNPAKFLGNYLKAMTDGLNPNRLRGKMSPELAAFYRMGVNLSQPLGGDIAATSKVAKQVFEGPLKHIARHPINALRELLGTPESLPRVAELRSKASEIGYKFDRPATFDEFVQLANAGKRVTVDFNAAGKYGKVLNQMIPFFNPNIQGNRSFVRAFQRNPSKAVLLGLSAITLPTLFNWWQNKDKDWYKDMPDRERAMYWSIQSGDKVIQIPRSQEWGTVFGSVPESMADSWYRQDPQGFENTLGYLFDVATPPVEPTLLSTARQQWQNQVEFFDRPIVPKSEEDLPPNEQAGPYTSAVAKWLGQHLPNAKVAGIPINSPRRIDAAIRSLGGGLAGDIVNATVPSDRQPEASDLPIIGRLFRRGGTVGTNSRTVDQFYSELDKAKSLSESKVHEETKAERTRRLQLENASKAMSAVRKSARLSPTERTQMIRGIAADVLAGESPYKPKPGPSQRQRDVQKQRQSNRLLHRYGAQ